VDGGATLYDRLGVQAGADTATLHRAYRRLAKRWHPDHAPDRGEASARMVLINEAWRVLGDPDRRAAYDAVLATAVRRDRAATSRPAAAPAAAWTSTLEDDPPDFSGPAQSEAWSRKDAWFAGLRVQVVRHTREAARSAALALALRRRGRPRAVYDAQIDPIVACVAAHVPERVKQARAAGAAPLDLGLATALVGLQELAGGLQRRADLLGWTSTRHVQAEMIDRMWDTLAHGVSHELAHALGGNPHVSRGIR
jgi:curved DNA-binding protein CbpA